MIHLKVVIQLVLPDSVWNKSSEPASRGKGPVSFAFPKETPCSSVFDTSHNPIFPLGIISFHLEQPDGFRRTDENEIELKPHGVSSLRQHLVGHIYLVSTPLKGLYLRLLITYWSLRRSPDCMSASYPLRSLIEACCR